MKSQLIIKLMSILMLLVAIASVSAQTNQPTTISLDENHVGNINPTQTQNDYIITVDESQIISMQMLSMTGNFVPDISVFNADNLQLPIITPTIGQGSDQRVTLPQAGTYRIVVNSQFNTSGEYILSTKHIASYTPDTIAIDMDSTVVNSFENNEMLQRYTFDASMDSPTTIIVSNDQMDWGIRATIRNLTQSEDAGLISNATSAGIFCLPAGFSTYAVEITKDSDATLEDYQISITDNPTPFCDESTIQSVIDSLQVVNVDDVETIVDDITETVVLDTAVPSILDVTDTVETELDVTDTVDTGLDVVDDVLDGNDDSDSNDDITDDDNSDDSNTDDDSDENDNRALLDIDLNPGSDTLLDVGLNSGAKSLLDADVAGFDGESIVDLSFGEDADNNDGSLLDVDVDDQDNASDPSNALLDVDLDPTSDSFLDVDVNPDATELLDADVVGFDGESLVDLSIGEDADNNDGSLLDVDVDDQDGNDNESIVDVDVDTDDHADNSCPATPKTSRDNINVRALPTTAAKVVAVVDVDSNVNVIGKALDATWLQVELFDGETGYAYAKILEVAEVCAIVDIPFVWVDDAHILEMEVEAGILDVADVNATATIGQDGINADVNAGVGDVVNVDANVDLSDGNVDVNANVGGVVDANVDMNDDGINVDLDLGGDDDDGINIDLGLGG